MAQKVLLKKSSVVNKVPSANKLDFGELAINYSSGVGQSFLATKKYDGTVAQFHEDAYNDDKFATNGRVDVIESSLGNYALSATVKDQISAITTTIEDNEYVIAQAFNDVNERLGAIEGITSGLGGQYLTIDSADTIVSTLNQQIGSAWTRAQSAFTLASATSATVKTSYWTSAETRNKIGSAVTSAVTCAVTYADRIFLKADSADTAYNTLDAKINSLSSGTISEISDINDIIEENEAVTSAALADLNARLSGVSTTINNLSGSYLTVDSADTIVGTLSQQIGSAWTRVQSAFTYASAISATVRTGYWTSATTSGKIATASANAITSAVSIASANSKAYTDSKIVTVNQKIEATSGSVWELSGAVKTTLSTVYKYRGTKNTYSQLPTGSENGDVWNVVSGNGTTPPGTNYAWVADSAETGGGHWDPLGGSVDLSAYLKGDSAMTMYNDLSQKIGSAWTRAQSAFTYASAISATVKTSYWDSATTSSKIATASANSITSAFSQSVASANSYTNGKIDTVNSTISQLSGSVTAFSASVMSEYATETEASSYAAAALGNAMAYTDSKISGLSIGDYLTVASATSKFGTIDQQIGSAFTGINRAYNLASATSATVTTSYWTSATTKDKIANASANAITSAVSIASANSKAYTDASIVTVNQAMVSAFTGIDKAYNLASATSATVTSSYWTSATTKDKIANASANAITSAVSIASANSKAYTDASIVTVNQSMVSAFTGIDRAYNLASATSASVTTGYWTSATTKDKIATASANAITSAVSIASANSKAYTDSKVNVINQTFVSAFTGIDKAYNLASATSASVTTGYWTSGTTKDKIASASANAITSAVSMASANSKAYTDNQVTTLQASIGSISGSVSALSASVVNNYATEAMASTYAAAALGDAMDYTDSKISGLSIGNYLTIASATSKFGTLDQQIGSAFTGINNAYNLASATSATVKNTYWTSATTSGKIATASANAITSAVSIASANSKTYTDNKITPIEASITSISGKVNSVSGKVIELSGEVQTRLSNVYKYMGSVATVAALPNSGKTNGYVYNVVAASGNPGEAGYVPAGTNYAWNGSAWDPLGGTVDLSGYLTKTSAGTMYDTLDGYISQLSSSTVGIYETIEEDEEVTASALNDLQTKYDNLSGLIGGLSNNYATIDLLGATSAASVMSAAGYVNTVIVDYATNTALGSASAAAVNSAVTYVSTNYVPKTRKVNGYALSADVTITKSDLGLGNVENTKLSNWTGNTSIASVGTITAGTWNGSKIANKYLANSAVTIDGQIIGLGTSATSKYVAQSNSTTTNFRPLALGYTTASTAANLTAATTGQVYVTAKAYVKPSDGVIHAGGYVIDGKAGTDLLNATGGVTTVATVTGSCVPTTRKVNGHALSGDVTVTKSDLSLGNVENTALSTWTGNTSIKSVGTITAGTWNGTKIGLAYLAQSAITIDGTLTGLGGSVTTSDKKVGQASSTAAERRALILGTTTAATGTALGTTAVTGETAFNKDIYAIPSTGELNSKQVRISEKVTIQYNSTTESLDFIFS